MMFPLSAITSILAPKSSVPVAAYGNPMATAIMAATPGMQAGVPPASAPAPAPAMIMASPPAANAPTAMQAAGSMNQAANNPYALNGSSLAPGWGNLFSMGGGGFGGRLPLLLSQFSRYSRGF